MDLTFELIAYNCTKYLTLLFLSTIYILNVIVIFRAYPCFNNEIIELWNY